MSDSDPDVDVEEDDKCTENKNVFEREGQEVDSLYGIAQQAIPTGQDKSALGDASFNREKSQRDEVVPSVPLAECTRNVDLIRRDLTMSPLPNVSISCSPHPTPRPLKAFDPNVVEDQDKITRKCELEDISDNIGHEVETHPRVRSESTCITVDAACSPMPLAKFETNTKAASGNATEKNLVTTEHINISAVEIIDRVQPTCGSEIPSKVISVASHTSIKLTDSDTSVTPHKISEVRTLCIPIESSEVGVGSSAVLTATTSIDLALIKVKEMGVDYTPVHMTAVGTEYTPSRTNEVATGCSPTQASDMGTDMTLLKVTEAASGNTPVKITDVGTEYTSVKLTEMSTDYTPVKAEDLVSAMTPKSYKETGIAMTPSQFAEAGTGVTPLKSCNAETW